MRLSDSIEELIEGTKGYELNELISKMKQSEELVIFGAGSLGEYIAKGMFSLGFKFNYFIDNDNRKWGQTVVDVPVISPQKMLELYNEKMLVLICSTWCSEIEQQLISVGINNFITLDFIKYQQIKYKSLNYDGRFKSYFLRESETFEQLYDYWFDVESKETFKHLLAYRCTGKPSYIMKSTYQQYFHPEVSPEPGDIIIDGGAFTGDTAKLFNDFLQSNCTIYSFEPSKSNYFKMLDLVKSKKVNNVIPLHVGLGKERAKLYMNTEGAAIGSGYSVSDKGNEEVNITTVDEFVKEAKVETIELIKLDIEGSELNALMGAYQSIKKFRPKLQICLYHKVEDLTEIPIYLFELLGDMGYKFYLGHHTESYLETVLYAKCVKKINDSKTISF